MSGSGFEELISAYLDGELPADERLLVEQQLAESAPLRQLYDDLKRQHETLRALPRYQPPADFAARIVAQIESSQLESSQLESTQLESTQLESTQLESTLPASSLASASVPDVRAESYARPAERTNISRKRFGWKTISAAVVTLAASLLIVLLTNDSGNVNKPGGPVVEKFELTEEAKKAFESRFRFLMIYDFAISPKGQKNRVFDKWMETAGLHVEKTLPIEERLQKGILNSRLSGEDKIVMGDPDKGGANDDVSMIFVRSTSGNIENLQRLATKAGLNDEILLRLNMTKTPAETEIFLQLNDAATPYKGDLTAFIESWKTPGVYPIQFNMGLHSASFGRFAAISGPVVTLDPAKSVGSLTVADLPVLPEIEMSELGTKRSDPSQILIILRKLKEPFPTVAKPVEAR